MVFQIHSKHTQPKLIIAMPLRIGGNLGGDTQNNNCNRSSCRNLQFLGNQNMNINCSKSDCVNLGSVGTENIACANGSACKNFGEGTQNTVCQSYTCNNSGTDTNVIAHSATTCTSGGSDTTTICQQGRTFVFPNH